MKYGIYNAYWTKTWEANYNLHQFLDLAYTTVIHL